MYDFVFGAPLPSKAESHASASAFDSCGEYLRTTRPGSAKTSVFFRMASDQTPHSIIQPPFARTSSDTQRFCAYKGHPDGPTLSLKTGMPGGSSTRARPSRKSRAHLSEFGLHGLGSNPGHASPTRPTHTQTTTWFRHAARAWTRCGLAWVLRVATPQSERLAAHSRPSDRGCCPHPWAAWNVAALLRAFTHWPPDKFGRSASSEGPALGSASLWKRPSRPRGKQQWPSSRSAP